MLGKITFASCGLGLTVLLAGGSMADKTQEPVSLAKPTATETEQTNFPNFAAVFHAPASTTESVSNNLAVAIGSPVDERRQLILERIVKITR